MNVSELLHDVVDGIEPADRLGEIRARVAESPEHAARPWWYAAGGVVLATAAAVTAFAVLSGDDSGRDDDVASETMVVPAYFVGDSPRGERLFREFDEVPAGDPLQAALDRIEQPASDPDYRTPWTASSFEGVMLHDGAIHVELGDAVLDDELAVQQVVYTLQAAAQERLPVLLGDESFEARPQLEVLNLVSISDPAEGLEVDGSFTARGVGSSFEATIAWEIQDESGDVVQEGSAMAEGWEFRLWPWETEVDVSSLEPGEYTFVAKTDDPTGGTEGPGSDSDTRTIIVR